MIFCILLQAAFESSEAYYKAIGYREEDGKLESSDSFVERIGSYMKLYGALVQVHFIFYLLLQLQS